MFFDELKALQGGAMNFVTHPTKPEWGLGLIVSEQSDRVSVLFKNAVILHSLVRSAVERTEPDSDQALELIETARSRGFIPYRELTEAEIERWRGLKPHVDAFVAAGSNKEGLESISDRIYDAFILFRPGASQSAVRTQLERWVNTNPSGRFASAIPAAKRLHKDLFG